jgi:small subunit ribosomal protein S1
MDAGDIVTVRGLELNKGGMIVSYEGVRGFVPTSQFGKSVMGDLESMLGKTFRVKVIEVDREKNRLIFSERHVSEEELIKQKTAALDAVKIGEIYEGVVSGILPFGAFVTLTVPMADDKAGHIEGLVHISEISWEKVEDPNKYVKSGDTVKVKVLAVDQSSGKLTLSIKQTIDDPWAQAKEKYPEGTVISGTVSRIAQFGIFVHLEAGIDGLVHISKIINTEMPRVGEDVSVTVESVDPEARRMSLSLTPTEVPMGYK